MPIAALHAPALAPTLASLKWRERVVLVFASSPNGPEALAQMRDLAVAERGLRERDLKPILITPDHVSGLADSPAALRSRFDVADGGFAVVLIGKDGHVAYRSSHPVAAADLFARIDAMPMRREEMRRRDR